MTLNLIHPMLILLNRIPQYVYTVSASSDSYQPDCSLVNSLDSMHSGTQQAVSSTVIVGGPYRMRRQNEINWADQPEHWRERSGGVINSSSALGVDHLSRLHFYGHLDYVFRIALNTNMWLSSRSIRHEQA